MPRLFVLLALKSVLVQEPVSLPEGAAFSAVLRFELRERGAPIGDATVFRRAEAEEWVTRVEKGFSLRTEREVRSPLATTITRRGGRFVEPAEVTVRREAERLHIEELQDGTKRECVTRVGNGAFAVISDTHLLALFELADRVPRISWKQRSFQGVSLDLLASFRINVSYCGIERSRTESGEERLCDLHRFRLESPAREWFVFLDGMGEWMRIEDPQARIVLQRCDLYQPMAAGDEAAEGRDARAPQAFKRKEACIETLDGKKLHGELLFPALDQNDLPAVLLLSGSGDQDRDGNSSRVDGMHGFLLRSLARSLANAGFVTFCLDDRGVGQSEGNYQDVRLRDLVTDANAALKFLSRQPRVDPKRVSILGHSEGGLIAALLCEREHASVAGAMLLSVPARPLEQALVEQLEQQNELDGLAAALCTEEVERLRQSLAMLRDHDASQPLPSALPFENVHWLRDHLIQDCTRSIAAIRVPVLLLHGMNDRQVAIEHARENLRKLQSAGNERVTLTELFNLDHLLMRNLSGDVLRNVETDRRVDPLVLERLVEWACANL